MEMMSAASQGMSLYYRVRNAVDSFNAVQDTLYRISTSESSDEAFDAQFSLGEHFLAQKLTSAAISTSLNIAGKAISATGRVLTIRNYALRGQRHPTTGIPFDKNGYPDFSSVAKKTVNIKQTGNREIDLAAANKAAGYSNGTPDGYVWHHNQDGTTMQLVPVAIHLGTAHTGGASLESLNLKVYCREIKFSGGHFCGIAIQSFLKPGEVRCQGRGFQEAWVVQLGETAT